MTTEERNIQLQIRYLVKGIYDIQKLRIATGNRIVQSFYIQMGIEPSTTKETADEDCKKLIKELMVEYNKVTEALVANTHTIKSQVKKLQADGELSYIKDELDYKMVRQYAGLKANEEDSLAVLKKYVHMHPMWDKFFAGVKGCGELMAGNCIAYLDIDKARHVSSFWKYCGLDVVPDTDADGNVIYMEDGRVKVHGRRKGDTEDYTYINKEGKEAIKKGLTYNPELRTKLLGVLSGCIIKVGQRNGYNKYEEAYRDYRQRLDNRADLEDASVGRKHNMAVRYMIKQFLRDLWVIWRDYEGYEISLPYEVEFLGRKPHKYNQSQVDMVNEQAYRRQVLENAQAGVAE